jgi:hypothetical protein
MNAKEVLTQQTPDEPTAWPSPWQLFWGWGRLGTDNRPSRWSRWGRYSVALFAGGMAAQAVRKYR